MIEKVSAALLLLFGAVVALISLYMPPEGEIDGSVLMLSPRFLSIRAASSVLRFTSKT